METAGLFDPRGRELDIPLKEVNITGKVCGSFAEIMITQIYENTGKRDLEAIYTFPIPDTALVSGFRAMIGGKTVTAEVKSTEEANKTYESAIAKGDSAFMLEQFRANIFQVSVGQILPGERVSIEITYIDELKFADRQLRLSIPTVVAPRYIPGKPKGRKMAMGSMGPTDRVPDADFISPPVGEVSYKASLNLEVDTMKATEISSPSHGLKVSGPEKDSVTVSFARETEALDRDLILTFTYPEELESGGVATDKGGIKLLNLTFIPDLDTLKENRGGNYTFLIDISGSMSGTKLEQAKDALQLCIRNLSQADLFNIVAFESRCHYFSKQSLTFTQKNLDKATGWIDKLASLGGTEIFEPIRFSLAQSLDTTILLFTDGQVGNEAEILNYVAANLGGSRIFTFGIDTAVNSYFINKLAEAGNGKSEFIYPGERIDDKVVRQFARIMSPSATEVKIDWGNLRVVDYYPRAINTIYDLDPVNIFARIEGDLGEIALTGLVGERSFKSVIKAEQLTLSDNSDLLEKAWARKKIEELENALYDVNPRRASRIKTEITELSIAWGLISSQTSFVAVYERIEKGSGLPVTRVVPVSLPGEWVSHKPISRSLAPSPSISRIMADNVEICCEPEEDKLQFSMAPSDWEDRDDYHSLTNIQRNLAKKQLAGGEFADSGDSSTQRFVTTVNALLAFVLSDGNLSKYKRQLSKTIRFILNSYNGVIETLTGEDRIKLGTLALLALVYSEQKGLTKGMKQEVTQVKQNLYALVSKSKAEGVEQILARIQAQGPNPELLQYINELQLIPFDTEGEEYDTMLAANLARLGLMRALG